MPTLFVGDKFVCLLYLLAERERKLHNIPTLQAVNGESQGLPKSKVDKEK